MISTLGYLQRLFLPAAAYAVNQPMLVADPTRPPAREVSAQRLGLSGAFERMAAAFLDQGGYLVAHLCVMVLPMAEVVPCGRPEGDIHGKGTAGTSESSASKPRTASNSRFAFAGDCSRYSVSSIDAHSLSEMMTAPSPR